MSEKELEKRIIDVLKSCYDPEIPVDIYELGLIYEIRIKKSTLPVNLLDETPPSVPSDLLANPEVQNKKSEIDVKDEPGKTEEKVKEVFDVEIIMTLTSPNCPVAESLPLEVENRVRGVEGINTASVVITFDPPWDKSMMSEAAQLDLGFL